MRVRRSRAIVALGLILMLGLASLYLSYRLGVFAEPDRSILTDEPCAAPCWQGIVPSQTTREEAIRILESSPFVSWLGRDCQRTEPRETRCTWDAKYWRGGGQLYIRDDIVYLMYKTPEINLTLGQAVNKYGPPEKVATHIGGVEELVYSFFLYYPSKGLIFGSLSAIEPGRQQASVTEDWRVTWIRYFAPTTLEGYLEVTQPGRPDHHALVLRDVEDWQGFGIYDFGSD